APALYAAIRRLNKAVVVDARKARERADQTDVWTFRRFDGTNAAVVRGVHVAHFESRAFARETAGPQSRKTALVRDFAERVGLVHELAELRRSKEFADVGHDRLGVDQVVRHGRGHFLVHAHLFLDGALHADQADAKLVFEKLADGAHPAVNEMIYIVDDADAFAQLKEVLDGRDEIRRVQRAIVKRRVQPHLDIELETAHTAEIVFARIEEHAAEKIRGGFQRRRIAGTQLAIDFDERFFRR